MVHHHNQLSDSSVSLSHGDLLHALTILSHLFLEKGNDFLVGVDFLVGINLDLGNRGIVHRKSLVVVDSFEHPIDHSLLVVVESVVGFDDVKKMFFLFLICNIQVEEVGPFLNLSLSGLSPSLASAPLRVSSPSTSSSDRSAISFNHFLEYSGFGCFSRRDNKWSSMSRGEAVIDPVD